MEQKQLFVLVEGSDDERFFRRILLNRFAERYIDVKILQYSQKTHKWLKSLLHSIKAMKADYMLLHDMDGSPCITQRKEKVHQKSNTCEEENIQIVVQEIESWYIAGLDENSCALLKLSPVKTTNTLTKEQFNQIIPFQFQRTDFMVEVLKQFSLDTAVTKNNSFRYFTLKYHLLSET